MASSRWFGWRNKSGGGKGKVETRKAVVLDGSDIKELVEDEATFSGFVENKFRELDVDGDGRLSVKELQPAVNDIGAALGLPAPGSSPKSDHIYSEVLSEFTHAGLNRDPIVILRIDGEDLKEFVESPLFETEAISMFSGMESAHASLRKCLTIALQQLTVDHGMPPASDSWVITNIVEPSFQSFSSDLLEQPASQDILENFKKLLGNVTRRLQEHPVIVAHSENTFDGSGIKRLLSNKFELDKLLDSVWRDLPKDHNQQTSKEYLRIALDRMAASASLPPYSAVHQVDVIINEAVGMVKGDDGNIVEEAEFKRTLTEILGSIMLQLEGNPVFVSTNSVVHEPLAASSTILPSDIRSE
ncbi:hypothetical protein OPV22_006330 [Ensete ventricosum]|uniref:EF-hand domain-containing protein n=1 Tax=Ensete ventricosum TaxID=4639 RepID=A0AAV8RSH0_ENSVE|nr:hypothetical protein OPV22_006330 [Ensete ventricosum]